MRRHSLEFPFIQVISLIAFLGFFSYTEFNVSAGEALRTDPLAAKGIRVATVVMAASMAAATLVKRRAVCNLRSGTLFALMLFCCSCLLSVPFSVYPLLSLFKSFEMVFVVLLCFVGITSTEDKPDDFFNWIIKLFLVLNLIVWVEALLFPDRAWREVTGETPLLAYMLGGVYPTMTGNMVGLLGAVLFLVYFVQLFNPSKRKLSGLLLCSIGLASVFCSYSRASLVGLVVAAIGSMALLKRWLLILVTALCFLLIGLGSNSRELLMDHLARGKQNRDIGTLSSGRIAMWGDVLQRYGVSIVGHGYAAGFRYDDTLLAGHAHNSIIEQYYNAGLVGVCAWLFMAGTICLALVHLWKSSVEIDYQLVSIISVMIFLLIKALASTVFVYFNYDFLTLAAVIVYAEKRLIADEIGGSLVGVGGNVW